jgi:hypothetical protein
VADPYRLAGVQDEAGVVQVLSLDYAAGHFLTMDGVTPKTSNDLASHAAYLVNLSATITVYVRGDGSAAASADAHCWPLFPQQAWAFPAWHDGRTLSVMGASGAVVQVVPVKSSLRQNG